MRVSHGRTLGCVADAGYAHVTVKATARKYYFVCSVPLPENEFCMALISHRGEMWARNQKNISDVLSSSAGGQGIYLK
jgi:hypothetical protein